MVGTQRGLSEMYWLMINRILQAGDCSCWLLREITSSLLLVLSSFLPGGVLQEVSVHLIPGQLDISHHAATDETVLDAQHVGILVGVGHTDICQLYIEILINLQYRQL